MVDLSRRSLLAAPLMMAAAPGDAQTIFDFTMASLDGGSLSFAEFRGKALLVVNTASFCGFTPQYEGLQRLHEQYAAQGFSVIGVPSNDFRQESIEAAQIREFCEAVYGITFPLSMPTRVRGPMAHPLFVWLARRGGGPPRWNFHKFLVGRDGVSVRSFATGTAPDAPLLVAAVAAALEGRALG